MPDIRSNGQNLWRRLAVIVLMLVGCLLLVPAASQAAQVFGSNLQNQPNETDCEMLGPCTVAAFVEVPAPMQLSNAGAPIDGVIARFRIRAKVETPSPVIFRVVDVIPQGANPVTALATATGTGPTVTLQTASDEAPPQEFPARLPVKKGQHLGIDSPVPLIASHDTGGTKFSYEYSPPLVNGAPARLSNEFLGELLVQATVEPDADRDGFGDETQDGCPTQVSTQGACDLTKPAIQRLRVRKGKISYRLTEAATVTFRLAKKRANGRFKAIGRPFSGPGNAGGNRRGLPRAKKLGPAVYRLSATATDVAGNAGTTKTVFRVRD
jgi:hypothetical protein